MTITCSFLRLGCGAAVLIAASSALSASAAATTATASHSLYKCVDAKGVVSIQSNPCPAGSTQTWRRDAQHVPPLTPEQQDIADVRRAKDQQRVRELSAIVDRKLRAATAPPPMQSARTAETSETPMDPCQSAQAFAGELRDKTWLGLTEEQIRRVYGWVSDQCKLPAADDDTLP